MSDLIKSKITEARQLLEQAAQEETQGASLTQQIQDLQRQSVVLLTSAREKRVIATSQLQAAESLNGGSEEVAAAPAAPVKPVGKGGRKKAAAPASAPVVTTPAAAAAAAPVAAAGKGKKAKATKKAAATTAKAAAPRVASGGALPPLHERLKIVIGADQVTIAEAIDRLKAHDKKWLPQSDDLKAYISLVLSTHTKDLFERVSRGIYKVRKGAAGPGVKKAVTAKATNGAQNPANGAVGIEDLGSNVLDNPFSGGAAA